MVTVVESQSKTLDTSKSPGLNYINA